MLLVSWTCKLFCLGSPGTRERIFKMALAIPPRKIRGGNLILEKNDRNDVIINRLNRNRKCELSSRRKGKP